MRTVLYGIWDLLKTCAEGFKSHKVAKLSSSLAFHITFTLGPILLIVMFLSRTFWGSEAIDGKIYNHIRDGVGDGTALQVQEIIKNATISGNDFIAVLSVVALLLSATSAFNEIQDSINSLWDLEVKKGRRVKVLLRKRLLSFAMLAALCCMLLILLVINVLLKSSMAKLQNSFPQISVTLIDTINTGVLWSVVALMFAIIFKILPDVLIKWKDVAIGALLTAGLFMFGKYCITLFIIKSNFENSYHTAGSLTVLLFWIYFSCLLLYSGVLFTKAYTMKYGSEIEPNEHAITIKIIKTEA